MPPWPSRKPCPKDPRISHTLLKESSVFLFFLQFISFLDMGFPGLPSHPGNMKYNNREGVARYLEQHHPNQYMIYNLSDEQYDTIFFKDKACNRVTTLSFQ